MMQKPDKTTTEKMLKLDREIDDYDMEHAPRNMWSGSNAPVRAGWYT